MQCQKCNNELEVDSKFCAHCGASVSEEVGKISSKKPTSYLDDFATNVMSFIVGIFAFTIIKFVFSLCLITLVKQNVISIDTYELYGFLFIFIISIYLAVKSIQALNEIEQIRTRIILRIVIIVVGFISTVIVGLNNSWYR